MRSYQSGVTRFVSFCRDINLSPFPLCESTLCHFVAFLVSQRLTLGTIHIYLSALRFSQIAGGRGGHAPSMADMARLHYVLRGISRVARRNSHPLRLPITGDILVRLFQVWAALPDQYEASLLWAAAALGFFGFM